MANRVLFHYPVFNVGGAEMSVLRLTRLLAERGWEVELVLTTGGGDLERQIDPRVKVTHLRDRGAGHRFLAETRPLHKLLLVGDLCAYLYYRLQGAVHLLPYLFRRYDAAIISLQGLSPAFCCRWVKAGKRLQWIRNDLSKCDLHGKAYRNIRKYHKQIDNYVCVSNTAYQSLIDLHPEVKDKAMVLYNVIDAPSMRRSATDSNNPYAIYGEAPKVVTVCRLLDKAKGLFRMLDVHKRLTDSGIEFYWFVVGDGPDREILAESVRGRGMEKRFILVGRKENPFPYYKYSDISATLSYYEGLCGAVNEAKVMGKPVIATHFSGVEEQITDGENGLIVGNDEQSIYEGLKRILTDSSLRAKLTNDILPRSIMDDEYKLELLSNIIGKGQSQP